MVLSGLKNGLIPLTLILAATLPGCLAGNGLIYTHTVRPLTVNMHRTPVVFEERKGGIKYLNLHYYNVSATWSSNAIGDIAKKNGINTIYYADLEYFTVLQVWSEYTVHIYGK
jgi:hypothetical protein